MEVEEQIKRGRGRSGGENPEQGGEDDDEEGRETEDTDGGNGGIDEEVDKDNQEAGA